jgi:DNA-binding NtrC family response regulator
VTLGEGVLWSGTMLTDGESERLKQCSVLIVEDEPVIALHLSTELSALGCRVTCVATLAHAYLAIAMNDFTSAILDVRLSDGDVFPLAAALIQKNVRIAFVSGHPKSVVEQSGYGHRPFLKKPIDMDALRQIVVQLAFE